MQCPKQQPNRKEPTQIITKLQSLTVEQKAYPFILIMGVLGAVFGGISAEIGFHGCIQSNECLMANMTQKKLDGIGMGAVAGMGAAVCSSLPVLLKGDRQG